MDGLIGIIDYGRGNLRSVEKALEAAGATTRRIVNGDTFGELAAVVLPGVGSFGDCAANLLNRKLWDPVQQWLQAGKPFLGICLGYQILFEGSEESPGVAGFGYFQGMVRRFPQAKCRKVPHMGWNTLRPDTPSPLFEDLQRNSYFYFVHSYYPCPLDESVVTAWCDYGIPFAAAAGRGNIQAVQFHPEKSQQQGLALLRNFLRQIP